jgi:hypothetical protein
VERLGPEDIAAILRGADSMIGRGGRTQLSKLLKGSREVSVIEHDLDRNPSYGFYRDLPIDQVLARIDWTIENELLDIRYAGRLPVFVFTPKGWAIEVVTMAAELLDGLEAQVTAGPPYDLSHLKDRNRELIFLLLDKIALLGRRDFIPLLRAWAEIDYQKVRSRIAGVIRGLEGV